MFRVVLPAFSSRSLVLPTGLSAYWAFPPLCSGAPRSVGVVPLGRVSRFPSFSYMVSLPPGSARRFSWPPSFHLAWFLSRNALCAPLLAASLPEPPFRLWVVSSPAPFVLWASAFFSRVCFALGCCSLLRPRFGVSPACLCIQGALGCVLLSSLTACVPCPLICLSLRALAVLLCCSPVGTPFCSLSHARVLGLLFLAPRPGCRRLGCLGHHALCGSAPPSPVVYIGLRLSWPHLVGLVLRVPLPPALSFRLVFSCPPCLALWRCRALFALVLPAAASAFARSSSGGLVAVPSLLFLLSPSLREFGRAVFLGRVCPLRFALRGPCTFAVLGHFLAAALWGGHCFVW